MSISAVLGTRRNARAALIMLLGMAFISTNDAILKHVSETVGTGQILMIRGVFISVLLLTYIRARGQQLAPPGMLGGWNGIRSACEMLATTGFVTALSLVPLAIAATLIWTSPLILTVLAALIMKDQVGPWRWMAVVFGFVGVLLVTQPGTDSWHWAMLLPLGAALIGAGRDLVTRFIGSGLSSAHVALASTVLTLLLGMALATLDWRALSTEALLYLGLSSVMFATGYTLFVTAIRAGEVTFVAPFSYSSVLFAIGFGVVFWGELPNPVALLGVVIIVVAGICVFCLDGPRTKAAGV